MITQTWTGSIVAAFGSSGAWQATLYNGSPLPDWLITGLAASSGTLIPPNTLVSSITAPHGTPPMSAVLTCTSTQTSNPFAVTQSDITLTFRDNTAWTLTTTPATTAQGSVPSASLSLSVNGQTSTNTTLKGVCYSPCPINESNANAPNLGDYFWDSFSGTGYAITGWLDLWQRDFPNLRNLDINTIRVYSMMSRHINSDGSYPSPWDSGQLFTHYSFLDQCWNGGSQPLYVLVGIPLPQAMFWQEQYQQLPQDQIDFWTNVLTETVTQLASHPAVLGFVIQNEMDSGVVTYGGNTQYVEFWWSQVQAMAQAATNALGGAQKLIGMAVHDDPNICGQAASYMATTTAIQFWGVNSYQTVNFDTVFGTTPEGHGYAGLTGSALKPVILTEWGMPATSHKDPNDPTSIHANHTTISNAAKMITAVVPTAFQQPLCLGLYYFEYSDEWWSQDGSPNIYTWYGGSAASGFPNGYWDQEGFGLYSVARGSKDGKQLPNDAPVWVQTGGDGGPNIPDVVTERTGTVEALKNAW